MSQKYIQKIVCAACKHPELEFMAVGPRHWDSVMRAQVEAFNIDKATFPFSQWEQGFIDQRGNFFNRKEAMEIAKVANQPIDIERGCGGSQTILYSEGLY